MGNELITDISAIPALLWASVLLVSLALHLLSTRRPAGAFLIALLVLSINIPASAQSLPAGSSPVFPPTYGGNTINYGGGSATAANASSINFGNPANGGVYANAPASVALPGGRSATVAIRSAPSAAAIAGAISRFAGKIFTPLVVGAALYDFAKEMGFGFDPSGGSLVVTKADPNICSVAPCYKYTTALPVGSAVGSTALASCQAAAVAYAQQQPGYGVVYQSNTETGCTVARTAVGGTALFGITKASVAPSSAVYLPSSLTEFEAAIAAKSGWPSDSAVGRVLTDAVKSGEVLPLPVPNQITGPASVPGTPTVVTNPDGSKVTTTPVTNITYGPSTVTIHNTTTVINTDALGNSTPGPVETAPAEMPETCGYPGGPACKIDESGTPESVAATKYDSAVDQYKQDQGSLRDKAAGASDKPFFTGWAVFFSAPAVAPCTAFSMPTYMGMAMPSLNPCGVVDGVRWFMQYLWAAAALYLCIGMVRKAI